MSYEITMHPEVLSAAIEFSLEGTAQYIRNKVEEITPRDMDRMPQNINRKDGLAPRRSTYYKPVNIGGNWYMGVSGKLKQSIAYEMMSGTEAKIWVQSGPTAVYAKFLEFWTSRMRPRSFLRKGIIDNQAKAKEVFSELMKQSLWKI